MRAAIGRPDALKRLITGSTRGYEISGLGRALGSSGLGVKGNSRGSRLL